MILYYLNKIDLFIWNEIIEMNKDKNLKEKSNDILVPSIIDCRTEK